ncbi:MAG: hypothetical protein J5517_01050 [Eubacterium sp.]|nr:hypothetical protein [Eubacterium sp.]
MLKSKIKWALLFLVVIIFVGCITFRFVQIYRINKPFISHLDYDRNHGKAQYYTSENGYVFTYKKASFFNIECFASVSTEEDCKSYVDANGNLYTKGMQVTLFIWPIDHTYGILLYENDNDRYVDEQIYIDENVNVLSNEYGYSETQEKYIADNKEKINRLFRKANEKWEAW